MQELRKNSNFELPEKEGSLHTNQPNKISRYYNCRNYYATIRWIITYVFDIEIQL
jgi:hypothetical protein